MTFHSIEKEINPNTFHYQIKTDEGFLSFGKVIDLWQHDENFIRFFVDILKNNSFAAYFWEVRPLTQNQLEEAFEFVLIKSSRLAVIAANKKPFKDFFSTDDLVISFPNLGRNAQLVVPTDKDSDQHYAHLAKFVRNASEEQIIAFWKKVGLEYEHQIGIDEKWLSTSGLGVYWLHVRIDSRPKYYQYRPYKIV